MAASLLLLLDLPRLLVSWLLPWYSDVSELVPELLLLLSLYTTSNFQIKKEIGNQDKNYNFYFMKISLCGYILEVKAINNNSYFTIFSLHIFALAVTPKSYQWKEAPMLQCYAFSKFGHKTERRHYLPKKIVSFY